MAAARGRAAGRAETAQRADKVARIRFPQPAPCGRTPLTAEGLSKSYGSLEVFTGVDLAIDRGSRVVVLGLNGAGKTTLLRLLGGLETPDAGEVEPGHGLRMGYFAQEHDTLDSDATCGRTSGTPRRTPLSSSCAPCSARSCSRGEQLDQLAGTLSGGEKTRLALAGLVSSRGERAAARRADEQPRPGAAASRCSTRCATSPARSCWSPTIPGAVEALVPERVILLPDGTEDHWSADYLELVVSWPDLDRLRGDVLAVPLISPTA